MAQSQMTRVCVMLESFWYCRRYDCRL